MDEIKKMYEIANKIHDVEVIRQELRLHVNKTEFIRGLRYICKSFKLNKLERKVISLYYYGDMSIKAISKRLRLGRNTIRQIIRRFKANPNIVNPVSRNESREYNINIENNDYE